MIVGVYKTRGFSELDEDQIAIKVFDTFCSETPVVVGNSDGMLIFLTSSS